MRYLIATIAALLLILACCTTQIHENPDGSRDWTLQPDYETLNRLASLYEQREALRLAGENGDEAARLQTALAILEAVRELREQNPRLKGQISQEIASLEAEASAIAEAQEKPIEETAVEPGS